MQRYAAILSPDRGYCRRSHNAEQLLPPCRRADNALFTMTDIRTNNHQRKFIVNKFKRRQTPMQFIVFDVNDFKHLFMTRVWCNTTHDAPLDFKYRQSINISYFQSGPQFISTITKPWRRHQHQSRSFIASLFLQRRRACALSRRNGRALHEMQILVQNAALTAAQPTATACSEIVGGLEPNRVMILCEHHDQPPTAVEQISNAKDTRL